MNFPPFTLITNLNNRTILVDNNTWNNTHISRVGQAMASDEQHAYEIMRELDVDYVLGRLKKISKKAVIRLRESEIRNSYNLIKAFMATSVRECNRSFASCVNSA